jgi:cytoskeletal protein CcmA (bactofilin family)
VVRGRIEGDVQAPSLAVSPSGAVHGRVRVGTVTSEGEIAGEFRTSDPSTTVEAILRAVEGAAQQ